MLQKTTKDNGFKNLSKEETEALKELSLIAERYEDSIPLMPIIPSENNKELKF